LAQNTGLPAAQAELMRHRDFDEIFFLAGASENEVSRFKTEAAARSWELRERGILWSLALGASLKQCVRDVSKLYTRALRSQPKIIGIGRDDGASELLAACDRGFVLVDAVKDSEQDGSKKRLPGRFREVELSSPDVWERILEAVSSKS
jgi:hypothetical protein